MTIVQVVPRRSNADGVGALAAALARVSAEYLGVEGRLLSPECGPALAHTLEEYADNSRVLLHYVGYGYDPAGCPTWLIETLEQWKSRSPERRLATFFHEVYASGLPWQRAFWTNRAQRELARRLVSISDATVTTLDLYAQLLTERCGARVAPIVLPMAATLPEPTEVPPFSHRAARLLVLGSAGNRQRVYRSHGQLLARACQELEVGDFCDVGPTVSSSHSMPVRSLGFLPETALASLLLDSRFAVVGYPPSFLPKSTTFANCCAYGVVPLCIESGPAAGGLLKGTHYLDLSAASREGNRGVDLAAIATAARSWYADHSINRHATLLLDLLKAV